MNILAECLKLFDAFGAKPNLIAEPHNSTCCGLILTILIIVLSVLTFCMTFASISIPTVMVSPVFVPDKQISSSFTSGSSLRAIVCSAAMPYMIGGPAQIANLRFYSYVQGKGKTYITPSTTIDAAYYGLANGNTNINVKNCVKIEDDHNIPMSSAASGT